MATLIERGLSMVTVWQPAHEKGSKPNIPKLNSSTTTYQLYFAGVEGWRGGGLSRTVSEPQPSHLQCGDSDRVQ